MTGRSRTWRASLVWTAVLIAVSAVFYRVRSDLDQVYVILTFLLVVLGASASGGRAVGFALACVSFLLIDYLFQRPFDALWVAGPLDALVLAAFLGVAGVTTHLLARATEAADDARRRADEIAFLARLGSEALSAGPAEAALVALARLIRDSVRVAECRIEPIAVGASPAAAGDNGRVRSIPLVSHGRQVGTLQLVDDRPIVLDPERQRFLDALAEYAALAVERVQLVAAAEHAEALREADRLKDGMLASVSHDLRTPLTTIKALAQDVARRGEPAGAVIEEQADRLSRLVGDLLDLSRLKGGAFTVAPDVNSVDDLIGAARRQVEGLRGRRALRQDGALDQPALYGRFDFVHTLRILTNLLENALRFSPPDTAVELHVRREGDRLRIAVRDHGAGIPEQERERIFEPFFRGAHVTPDTPGTGLGLSIARHLARLQEGDVICRAAEGGGSVFSLELPAADPSS